MFSPASIAVDRTSPVPLYYQVAQQLEQAIEVGELAPGIRLDNEIDLAARLGVSRPTMRPTCVWAESRSPFTRKRLTARASSSSERVASVDAAR